MLEDFRKSLARARGAGANPLWYSLKFLLCVLLCFAYISFGRDVKVSAAIILAVCLGIELVYDLPPMEATLSVVALALIVWFPVRAWAKLADERDRAQEEEWKEEEIEEGAEV